MTAVVGDAGVAGFETARAATIARRYLASRRRREALLAFDGFADPAWDILLDLFAAQAEGRRVSVSSACIASCVATSTAVRWVGELERRELLVRRPDPTDGRRSFVELGPGVADAVERWLTSTFLQ